MYPEVVNKEWHQPPEGSVSPGQAGDQVKSPLSQRNGLYAPRPKSQLFGDWAPQTLGKTFSPQPHSPPSPSKEETPGRSPTLPVSLSWYPPWWPQSPQPCSKCMGASLSQLRCGEERVTMQSTAPYVGHALALSFSWPIGICAKGIPQPWHWA